MPGLEPQSLAFFVQSVRGFANGELMLDCTKKTLPWSSCEAMPFADVSLKHFNNTTDNLFLLEVMPDGRFRNLEVNHAFARMIGTPMEALIGKYVDEAVSPETARLINAKYHRCLQAGTVIEETVELDLPKGRSVFHSVLMPLRDAKGRINRIFGISCDLRAGRTHEHCLPVVKFALNKVNESIFLIDEGGPHFVGQRRGLPVAGPFP